MKGWNTQHEEFTLTNGDPIFIKQMIAEFRLNKIVSYDESTKLITTTIKHDQHIRLSDLIVLNVNKVIAFTLPQYLCLIKQLFFILQEMLSNHFEHLNLTPENIILDLTKSENKLDNQQLDIIYRLKLINFAKFYNFTMKDDFQQICLIYDDIMKLFPQVQSHLQQKTHIKDYISEIDKIVDFEVNYPKTTWNPEIIPKLQSYYQSFPIYNVQCKEIATNLHQYHLIVNHYNYLCSKTKFDIFEEPYHLRSACTQINELICIDKENQIYNELRMIKSLLTDMQHFDIFDKVQFQIQQNIIIYLKQQGYFENIHKFTEIAHNFDHINNSKQKILRRSEFQLVVQVSIVINHRIDHELINAIEQTFVKSFQIFKIMVQKSTLNRLKKQKDIKEVQEIFNCKDVQLIQQLDKINAIAHKFIQQSFPNCDFLTQCMIEGWLKWVDQYIFDQQFSKLEQLMQINEFVFKQFMQEQGHILLDAEMKRHG